jgi:NDP-sugar pyrophosphorylase family protein
MGKNVLKAIVPAAEEGSKMKPLSDYLPKALLPVDGKQLILEHTIKYLEGVGVTDIYIILDKRFYDVVQESVDRGYKGPCKIHFKIQHEINGLGFVLLMCKENIGNENFVLMFPDIFQPQLNDLDKSIFSNPCIVALPSSESNKYIGNWAVEVDEKDAVKRFVYMTKEHAANDNIRSIHTPLTLPAKIFEKLEKHKDNKDEYQWDGFQLIDSMQELVEDGVSFPVTTCGGYFKNINTIEDYADVLRYHICDGNNVSTLL